MSTWKYDTQLLSSCPANCDWIVFLDKMFYLKMNISKNSKNQLQFPVNISKGVTDILILDIESGLGDMLAQTWNRAFLTLS